MDDYVWEQIVDYFRGLGYSKKQAKRVADNFTDSVVDALEQQLDIELGYVKDNISREED